MTTPPNLPAEAPPLTLELPSAEKTIKMVYGLEMDLRRILPDPQSAMQLIMNDAFTQDYVVRRCLSDSKKMILSETDLIPYESIEISSEDVERLLAWVMEHSLYFFMKRASGMASLAARYGMGQLRPSSNGSAASASENPSAGDSTASKAN